MPETQEMEETSVPETQEFACESSEEMEPQPDTSMAIPPEEVTSVPETQEFAVGDMSDDGNVDPFNDAFCDTERLSPVVCNEEKYERMPKVILYECASHYKTI